MIASSLVTPLARMNPDWQPAQLLSEINDLVQSVLQRESDANVYIDGTTGDLPYLATTGGTFQYTVSIAQPAWKFQQILVDAQMPRGTWGTWSQDTGHGLSQFYAFPNPDDDTFNREVDLYGKRYRAVPVQITQPLGNAPASVIFRFDPGTTTNIYRVMAYLTPTTALSMSSQIPIEESMRYDFIAFIQEIIDAKDNGRFAAILPTINAFRDKIEYSLDKDTQKVLSKPFTY